MTRFAASLALALGPALVIADFAIFGNQWQGLTDYLMFYGGVVLSVVGVIFGL